MKRARDELNLLERISLSDVRGYLERSGWRSEQVVRGKWQVFKLVEAKDQALELVLPLDSHYVDTRDRIAEVLAAVAQIEERTRGELYAALVSTSVDSILVQLKVPGQASELPLNAAASYVRAIRNLILYSGCSELDARPHYEVPLPGAKELAEAFSFCHTFPGSFGFEIANSLVRFKETPDFFQAPIQRRMVERLARGLILLHQAVENDEPSTLIRSFDTAFNARMCDALVEIGGEGELSFELGIEWASAYLPNLDVRKFSAQAIDSPEIEMLRHVSEQLKLVEPEVQTLSGVVVNLHCVGNPTDGSARRTIAVRAEHEKHGVIEVKLAVSPDEYLIAIDAHATARKLSAVGALQRKGNSWTLEDISSIEVSR